MRGQGVALIVVLVVLGFALFSPWAFLVRYDPLYVNDEAAVENLACSYSTGVRSATIFFIGYKHGADCPRFYKFGSVPHCAGRTDLPDGVCLWSQGLIFSADND